eukprot:2769611-Rhodomonas_salina.1
MIASGILPTDPRMRYAVSSTVLRMRDAMSGTDLRSVWYRPRHALCDVRYRPTAWGVGARRSCTTSPIENCTHPHPRGKKLAETTDRTPLPLSLPS